ncbi:hypothetical protein RRSWK_00204 [Rhodopirellula sp. SWK7]|nr:hypothetical protein RRSWK_00204 [Rhodopirellula sp. SWK7]
MVRLWIARVRIGSLVGGGFLTRSASVSVILSALGVRLIRVILTA